MTPLLEYAKRQLSDLVDAAPVSAGTRLARRARCLPAILVLCLPMAAPARAGGVVGTGTPGSCTATALAAALVGGGLVTFDCGPNPVTITLAASLVPTAFQTIVDGGGLVTISGGNGSRVFTVNDGLLTLRNLRLTAGYSTAGGGCIYVSTPAPTLILDRVTVDNCVAQVGGGLYANDSYVQIVDSTLVDNRAIQNAGAIFHTGQRNQFWLPDLSINGSTIARNRADLDGGGVVNTGTAPLVLANSTVSENVAGALGGGLYVWSPSTFNDVTIDANISDDYGGGVFFRGTYASDINRGLFRRNVSRKGPTAVFVDVAAVRASNLTLVNFLGDGPSVIGSFGALGAIALTNATIVSSGPTPVENNVIVKNSIILGTGQPTCSGGVTSSGFNISSDPASCLNHPTDRRGINPQLAPLADNGGPTLTYRLLPSSPAIDTGTGAGCAATDQRGVARPYGIACDVGAYEVPELDLAVAATATPPTVPLGQPATFTFTIRNPSTTAPAVGVQMTAEFLGFAPVSVTPSQGTCAGLRCAIGLLAPGATASIQVTATARAVGTRRGTAFAASGDVELTPADNTASAQVVVTPTTAQPPTGLVASSISGNKVTLRWSAPAQGPAPTGYALEGGVNPGEVLASVPTGSAYPIFTFTAPTGTFYVRVHTLTAAGRSPASDEIRIFVNTPATPSAPADLLGLVAGSTLGLTWRNTFAGGELTSIVLDVSGAFTGSLPLGATDHFDIGGVPAGTYAFRVRATNAVGTSVASNAVTLTFPAACSGAPLPPSDFLAYALNRTVFILWAPATTGPAPTGYVVGVSGSVTASVATSGRELSAAAPPGTYTLSVAATNACGTSPPTAAQTLVVP